MGLFELMLAAFSANDLGSRNRLTGALRSRGAVSPASARPLNELGVTADAAWRRLVIEGRIREGPPGDFYLFEPPRPSTRERVVKMVVFYLLIVLIPIVLFLASANRR
jgi:hypothetical protein